MLIDRTFAHSYWVEQMLPGVERGLGNGTYRLVSGDDGIELYERLR